MAIRADQAVVRRHPVHVPKERAETNRAFTVHHGHNLTLRPHPTTLIVLHSPNPFFFSPKKAALIDQRVELCDRQSSCSMRRLLRRTSAPGGWAALLAPGGCVGLAGWQSVESLDQGVDLFRSPVREADLAKGISVTVAIDVDKRHNCFLRRLVRTLEESLLAALDADWELAESSPKRVSEKVRGACRVVAFVSTTPLLSDAWAGWQCLGWGGWRGCL